MLKFPLNAVLICISVAGLALGAAAQQHDEQAMTQYAQAGQRALAAGDYALARSNFEQAVQAEPDVAELHATLAAICFKQRDYERAIREARTALKLKPSLPRVDSLLGLSLGELGQYNDAVPKLEKGLSRPRTRMCGACAGCNCCART